MIKVLSPCLLLAQRFTPRRSSWVANKHCLLPRLHRFTFCRDAVLSASASIYEVGRFVSIDAFAFVLLVCHTVST